MRNAKTILGWMFVAIVAFVLLGGIGVFLTSGIEMFNSAARRKAEDTNAIAEQTKLNNRIRNETVLVIGVSENDEPLGFAYVRLDRETNTVNEITIRPDVIIPTPGGTSEVLRKLYREDPVYARACLSEYMGIPAAHWITTSVSGFQRAAQDQQPYFHFTDIQKTNFSKKEFLAYRTEIENLPDNSTTSATLASNPVECNDELYVEPHREESAAYINEKWGVDTAYLSAAPLVSVYNGTKANGLGGKVAKELLFEGFQIAEITNANKDDYQKTIFVCQKDAVPKSYEGDIEKIRKLFRLDSSEPIQNELDADSGCKIAIYIGADCKLPSDTKD